DWRTAPPTLWSGTTWATSTSGSTKPSKRGLPGRRPSRSTRRTSGGAWMSVTRRSSASSRCSRPNRTNENSGFSIHAWRGTCDDGGWSGPAIQNQPRPTNIEGEAMSGHSHWATIKHKKGAIDAKRGKLFSKLSRAIIIAARHGGGDPEMNLKLRYAIDKARQVSMPKDNIERAIKRGTGEVEGLTFEEITYEGYGPGGVPILVDVLTDNRNRTAGEIRKIFERSGGKLGSAGCVGYLFKRKGVFGVEATAVDEDTLMGIVLDAGAEDMKRT